MTLTIRFKENPIGACAFTAAHTFAHTFAHAFAHAFVHAFVNSVAPVTTLIILNTACIPHFQQKSNTDAFTTIPSVTPDTNSLRMRKMSTIAQNEYDPCKTTDDPFEIGALIVANQYHPNPPRGIQCSKYDKAYTNVAFDPQDRSDCCISPVRYRPALKLFDDEIAAWKLPSGREWLSIANVRGIEGFYVASIPVNSIQKMWWNERPISGIDVGHAQIIAEFSEPVILKKQYPADISQEFLTKTIVFSFQGVGNGKNSNDYFITGSVFTLLEKVRFNFVENREIDELQYQLNLTNEQMRRFVNDYVETANTFRLTKYFGVLGKENWEQRFINILAIGQNSPSERQNAYFHIGNEGGNCTTELFFVLDSILSKSYSPEQKTKIANCALCNIVPQESPTGLVNRGLINSVAPHRTIQSIDIVKDFIMNGGGNEFDFYKRFDR